ncbi:U3 small nucleolar RNA-associated protein 14 homolog A [Gastrophryne carolinensis]
MEDEEDLFVADYPLSASEDEQEDGDSQHKHQKLLEAISSLDGKKRRKVAERTEAGLQVSEFAISSEGTGDKISLSDLIEPIKKSTSLSTVKKQLNKLKEKKSVALPLSKEETQKIQRVVAYQAASEEINKWQPVVAEIRKADKLVFPLNDEAVKPARIEEVVTGWKARTPLEMEIFNILHKNNQPITDPLLTPVEEASLKAMSLEEARLRRAELQKARALQSYYEAKARRAKKIKSKKYHKQLKKGKKKEAVKEFEELRRANPEAALEELEKLDRARMQERMSLKHQNSGKWAKSKAIMAKYDDEARKAMQEQLQRNKELTRKVKPLSESEDEEEQQEETIPEFVNDAQVISEGPNPWMTGKLSTEAKDSGGQEEEEEELKIEEGLAGKPEEEEVEEEEQSEEETLLQEFEEKRRWRKEQGEQETVAGGTGSKIKALAPADPEDRQASQFNLLFQKLAEQNRKEGERAQIADPEEAEPKDDEGEELRPGEEGPLLTESLDRKRTLEDVEGLVQEGEEELTVGKEAPPPKKKPANRMRGEKSKLINREDVLPAKAQKVRTPMVPTMVEEEEEEDADYDVAQKLIIQEAFAGDDVIADFLNEKRKAENDAKPKDISLVLPGWGEWGGTNLKVSKKKRKKFTIKAAPAPPRRDQRLPNVIINEKRNIQAAAHQVNELPFPFNNRKQFESSIRAPVGNTWNTESAAQKLAAPKVITKQGHIIQPITMDHFQERANAKKPQARPSGRRGPTRPKAGKRKL